MAASAVSATTFVPGGALRHLKLGGPQRHFVNYQSLDEERMALASGRVVVRRLRSAAQVRESLLPYVTFTRDTADSLPSAALSHNDIIMEASATSLHSTVARGDDYFWLGESTYAAVAYCVEADEPGTAAAAGTGGDTSASDVPVLAVLLADSRKRHAGPQGQLWVVPMSRAAALAAGICDSSTGSSGSGPRSAPDERAKVLVVEAAECLGRDLVACGVDLLAFAALSGPATLARALAAAALEASGSVAEIRAGFVMAMRLFAAPAITDPPRAEAMLEGELRRVEDSDADRAVVIPWLRAFFRDAFADPTPEELLGVVFSDCVSRGLYFWCVDGGDKETAGRRRQPVSMGAVSGVAPHSRRLGLIYTPPEQRGRGYGSCLTVALSRSVVLEELGCAAAVLYTDLANPVSNKIYQRVGYRPLGNYDIIKFVPRVPGRAVIVSDREMVAAFLRKSGRQLHAYALGDLDDVFWPKTRWCAWRSPDTSTSPGSVEALAMLYTGLALPSLHILVPAGVDRGPAEQLLDALVKGTVEPLDAAGEEWRLPAEFEAHLSPGLVNVLTAAGFHVSGSSHVKMALPALELDNEAQRVLLLERLEEIVSTAETNGFAVRRLVMDDADECERLAATAPETWFEPHVLEEGPYFGALSATAAVFPDADAGGAGGAADTARRLLSMGGTHVFSPSMQVAALGNVATLPDAQRRGLARAVTAKLLQHLVAECGVRTVALNVRADNSAARALYRSLGFEDIAHFWEFGKVVRPS